MIEYVVMMLETLLLRKIAQLAGLKAEKSYVNGVKTAVSKYMEYIRQPVCW